MEAVTALYLSAACILPTIYDLIYKRIRNKQLDDATPHNRSAVLPDDAPSERLRHLAAQHKQRRNHRGS